MMTNSFGIRRQWIAYVGPFSFPNGGAAARRILGNAQSLSAGGFDVVILSGQKSNCSDVSSVLPGIWLASVNERDAEHLPLALRRFRYIFMGKKTRDWLLEQPNPPFAVILYSGYTPYILKLRSWAIRNGVKLIFDAVEWYTAKNLLQFIASPYLWNIEFAMRYLNKQLDGLIAISGYLHKYYHAFGIPVVKIPPTLDIAAISPRISGCNDTKLLLAYCGSPGTKDLLNEVVSAVLAIRNNDKLIQLHIAGSTIEDVMKLPALANYVGDISSRIVIHGLVSHEKSMDIVRSADFSIFLRKQTRVSAAGFPTKFVESLALGTPVITNLTSDINLYMNEGVNGLICPEPTVEALEAVLEKARLLTNDELIFMRTSSRAMAEKSFDYRHFVNDIANFCKNV